MNEMKKETGTLAALKRRMQVGVKLLCVVNTKRPMLNGQRREVIKCQQNSFVWRREGVSAERSWTEYPKAPDLKWIDEDTFQIQMTPEHHVQLRFVS